MRDLCMRSKCIKNHFFIDLYQCPSWSKLDSVSLSESEKTQHKTQQQQQQQQQQKQRMQAKMNTLVSFAVSVKKGG